MRSTLEQFTEFFVHEFMEELWYLQKVARGDIAARPDVDPWEKFFNVAQALLSLSPIPGLPGGLVVLKEVVTQGVDFMQEVYQAGKAALDKLDMIEEKYESVTHKIKPTGLMDTLKQGIVDLEAMRSLAELLGRGLSQRYEQILTDILDTDQPEKSTILLAREGARRCFQYLQSRPFFDEKSKSGSLLSQRLRLMNSVNLGKIDQSWREQIVNTASHRLPRWIQNMGKEKLVVKPERIAGISREQKMLTAKADFTAQAFYTRSAWYNDSTTDCYESTVKSEDTTWWQDEKQRIQYPKYGYAYLEGIKQLPLEQLILKEAKKIGPGSGGNLPFFVPKRQQRIYQPVTAKEIIAYLESDALKAAKKDHITASLTFHKFLHQHEEDKYPENCQAVCHEDFGTLPVTLAYGNFTQVDFSGATISGDVTGCCFDHAYLVSTVFTKITCDTKCNHVLMLSDDIKPGNDPGTIYLREEKNGKMTAYWSENGSFIPHEVSDINKVKVFHLMNGSTEIFSSSKSFSDVTSFCGYTHTEKPPLRFTNANLAHAQLVEAKIAKVNFNQTNLSFANLDRADITNAETIGTQWYKTRLSGVEQKDLLGEQKKQIETMQAELKKWQSRMDERVSSIARELEPMERALTRLEVTIQTAQDLQKAELEKQKEELLSLISQHAGIEWVRQYLQEELEKLRIIPGQAKAMAEIQEKMGGLIREKEDIHTQLTELSKTILQLSKEVTDLQEMSKNHELRLLHLARQKSDLRIKTEEKFVQIQTELHDIQDKVRDSGTKGLQKIHQQVTDCKWGENSQQAAATLNSQIRESIQQQEKRLSAMAYYQRELKDLRESLRLSMRPESVRKLQARIHTLQEQLTVFKEEKIHQSINFLSPFEGLTSQHHQLIELTLRPLNDRFNAQLQELNKDYFEKMQQLGEDVESLEKKSAYRLQETEAMLDFIRAGEQRAAEAKEIKTGHLEQDAKQHIETLQNELDRLNKQQKAQQSQQEQYQRQINDLQIKIERQRQVDPLALPSLQEELKLLRIQLQDAAKPVEIKAVTAQLEILQKDYSDQKENLEALKQSHSELKEQYQSAIDELDQQAKRFAEWQTEIAVQQEQQQKTQQELITRLQKELDEAQTHHDDTQTSGQRGDTSGGGRGSETMLSDSERRQLENERQGLQALRDGWVKLKGQLRVSEKSESKDHYKKWKITTAFPNVQALREHLVTELFNYPRTDTVLALVGDLKVEMKDIKPEATFKHFKHIGEAFSFTQMPNGHLISISKNDNTSKPNSIKVWDLSETIPKCETTIDITNTNRYTVNDIKALPNGQLAVSSEGGIFLWDITKPDKPTCTKVLKDHDGIHYNTAATLAVHPNGQLISYEHPRHYINLWDTTAGISTAVLAYDDIDKQTQDEKWGPYLMAFPDGRVANMGAKGINVWDISSGQRVIKNPIMLPYNITIPILKFYGLKILPNNNMLVDIRTYSSKLARMQIRMHLMIDTSTNHWTQLSYYNAQLHQGEDSCSVLLADGRIAIYNFDKKLITLHSFSQSGIISSMDMSMISLSGESIIAVTALTDGRLVVGCAKGTIMLFRCPMPQYQLVIDWRFQSVLSAPGVLTEILSLPGGVKLTTSQSCVEAFHQLGTALKILYPGSTLHCTITDKNLQVNGFTPSQMNEFLSLITAMFKPIALREMSVKEKQHPEETKMGSSPKWSATPSHPQTVPTTPSKEQLKLQDELIIACEQGDDKAVNLLLEKGAKPDMANTTDKQPLGAAVWGMNPAVVNTLIQYAGDVVLMTWEECEKHNLERYNDEFIVLKFDPRNITNWLHLLQKISQSPLLRAYHLKKVDEQWHDSISASWDNLQSAVVRWQSRTTPGERGYLLFTDNDPSVARMICSETEKMYAVYRTQIKERIESTSQSEVLLPSTSTIPPSIAEKFNFSPETSTASPSNSTLASSAQSSQVLLPEIKSVDDGVISQNIGIKSSSATVSSIIFDQQDKLINTEIEKLDQQIAIIDKRLRPILVPMTTKVDGDCALHAILGIWNPSDEVQFNGINHFERLQSSHQAADTHETYDQEGTREFKKHLADLLTQEDGGYQFVLRRSANSQLTIRFTAANSVSSTVKEIEKNLGRLQDLFKKACSSVGIQETQYNIAVGKNWMLTIEAESPILDKIAKLLQVAGLGYLPSAAQTQAALFYQPRGLQEPTVEGEELKSVVTCAVQ